MSSSSSSTVPIIASSSATISLPSHEMSGNRLFQFYLESFFKIPRDIKNDIIYCQRALKAHIKVHQMVLDVFQQQPDADPEQKKRIVEEIEATIYEMNAEQNFIFLRLRRIIDEFLKMLNKNDIPTDINAINAFISKEIIPLINNVKVEILPINVRFRNTEEKLIDKYFEVQKDHHQNDQKHQHFPAYANVEIIDVDDEDANAEEEKAFIVHGKKREDIQKDLLSNISTSNNESLLKNHNSHGGQPSLLKPLNQRMTHDSVPVNVKPKIIKHPVTTLGDIYNQKKEEKEKPIELPVSTNVRKSRMNLRQALKRAQAAVRGPSASTSTPLAPPLPPPPTTSLPSETISGGGTEIVVKKSTTSTKTKNTRTTVATATIPTSVPTVPQKLPERSSSSEEGTPERGHTPPHNFWPDEYEEARTKPEDYGQEMFLRELDLCTLEFHSKLQQRRSKRRRRCVKNNNYHYGRVDEYQSSGMKEPTLNEPNAKKKGKEFLLSPAKKAIPAKRTSKRRSVDGAASTSRSTSSSPDDKPSCNKCLKNGNNLQQCEECQLYYHFQCHREKDDEMIGKNNKKSLEKLKKCPGCKKKHGKIIKKGILLNKSLRSYVQELELQYSKEKDRQEILQRTGKSYKIQMNNLYKVVNLLKNEATSASTSSNVTENMVYNNSDNVIYLD